MPSRRTSIATIAGAVFALGVGGCAVAEPLKPGEVIKTGKADFRVVTVAPGLENPWGMAWLPDGRMLVTERPGRLRLVTAEGTVSAPLSGVPTVLAAGQGGLLDVAVDPAFPANQLIYLSHSWGEGDVTTTRVTRARLTDDGLVEQTLILDALPHLPSSMHYGSRLAFADDGTLYVTVGERSSFREKAQDLTADVGKVLRINTDGSIPPDNPFVGRDDVRPEIYSWGHRNPQGLALRPGTGEMWEIEHGARGGDELNRLRPGANYGWPVIAYGVNYNGTPIGEGRSKPGMEQPVHYWDPSIAPSGLTFYQGDKFPDWRGSVLTGALSFQLVARMELDEAGNVTSEERFLENRLGRIRDVRTGPDGYVYLLTDERDGGLYRLEPA